VGFKIFLLSILGFFMYNIDVQLLREHQTIANLLLF